MKTWTPRICSECHHKPSEGSDPLKSDAGGICYCACHRQCDLAPEMAEALRAIVECPDYRQISTHEMRNARSLLARLEGGEK